jgi:hypothetical protein
VDYGFGAAATLIVQGFRFSNPRQKPTSLQIRVKFELAGDNAQSPAQLPPPQAPAGG